MPLFGTDILFACLPAPTFLTYVKCLRDLIVIANYCLYLMYKVSFSANWENIIILKPVVFFLSEFKFNHDI